MKRIAGGVLGLVCVVALAGCATKRAAGSASSMRLGAAGSSLAEVRPDRLLIWSAYLSVQVKNVSNAVSAAVAVAERQGGYVEQKSDNGEQSARVTLRIPAQAFKLAVASLEALGAVTHRNVKGEDVTEQYIDVEARLKNKIVLRDRLKQLLEKAADVKDILAIETELSRVQADIDSMEGRLKSLKGQVEYASVTLNLERTPILGPLGLLFKGLWWGIEKLFVIRD